MKIHFYKYQGTGNDFVLLDQMKVGQQVNLTKDQIAQLCDRKFGIGADGFMYLRPHDTYDFEMVYFNSDGNESTMCGNGGRCIVQFAYDLKHIGPRCSFVAIDGPHEAKINKDENVVELKMINVENVLYHQSDTFEIFTGSPHYVHFSDRKDIVDFGREVRYSDRYQEQGINVNLVQDHGTHISMRTYERGVENETLSCGTGVTAAVIATASKNKLTDGLYTLPVKVQGGELSVRYAIKDQKFQDIWLIGPAQFVFEGTMPILQSPTRD